MSQPRLLVFTDGACSGNPGPGGWAAILVSPLGKIREIGGGVPKATNNQMELTAAIEALVALSKFKSLSSNEVHLFTDSKYVIQGITEWIHGWKRRGWLNQEGQPVANREYWLALEKAALPFRVQWNYVAGHSGNPGNDRCDAIAVAFSKGQTPALYVGLRQGYSYDIEQTDQGPKRPAVYLSWVDGELFRDFTWQACQARVSGKPGAKYKKVESAAAETAQLQAWDVPETKR